MDMSLFLRFAIFYDYEYYITAMGRNITPLLFEKLSQRVKAIFHCSRFARAGGAGFENLLTRA
jgi:hypothetical protein